MKQIAALFRDRLLLIALFGSVGAIILSSLSSNVTAPDIAEYFNTVAAIIQAKMALIQGQLPLRVAPSCYSGWHYALFEFSSPTGYTLTGLIYQWLSPDNPYVALKLAIWFAVVCGGIYMYRLVCWIFHSRSVAVLASVMYLTTPYYIIVIDHIGGFTEAIALGIVPAVLFYTLHRYFNPSANKTLLQTSLVWYLLATIHVITFIYTSLFVGILLLFLVAKNPKSFLNFFDTVLAYIFGCLLALWHLGPVYLLQKYLNVDSMAANASMFTAYKPYLANLLSPAENISQPILSGTGKIGGLAIIHPGLGFPLLFAVIVSFYAFFHRAKLDNPRANDWLGPLLSVFTIAFLMAWSPVDIWKWLPHSLMIGLYSWRFLGQVIWIGALLFAWSLCYFFENKLDARHVVLGLFLIIMATSTWLPVPERNFIDLNIPELVKNPVEANNAGPYLLSVNKNIMNINAVDKMPLTIFNGDSNLIFNKAYSLSRLMFITASQPLLEINGNIPEQKNLVGQSIQILINGVVSANFPVKSGHFQWSIPLAEGLQKLKNNSRATLEFKSSLTNDKPVSVSVSDASVSGFLDPKEIMDVKQTQQHCEQKGSATLCQIDVPATIKLIELPVLYYPDMLNITLNGKPASYSNVLYQKYFITAIHPEPGQNTINIEFRGLIWANSLSAMSWGLWLLFLVYVLLKRKPQTV